MARAADVGVSIHVAQPGVYGRIDIGRFPQPVLVVPQPTIIVQPARQALPQPVYLWVPPGHQRNWRKHCAAYRACGVPVYFVEDGWYRGHVLRAGPAPERPHGPPGHARGRGHDKHGDHPGKGHGRD